MMINTLKSVTAMVGLLMLPAVATAGGHTLPEMPAPEHWMAPPVNPEHGEIPPPEAVVLAYPAAGLTIDTGNREAVRVFFKGLYSQSENISIGWTGAHDGCVPGSTGQLYQDGVALRVNWFRAMAGIPASINLYGDYSLQDQAAALTMSANNSLSHYPPATWNCWTQTAYDAAGKSNLSLGAIGSDAVTGYMRDPGTSNAPVGHRRWILYPQTQNMGTGDVPAGTYGGSSVMGANALWTVDSNFGKPRPTVRDDFVAWPPKGYVPYQVMFGRWSISHSNADFSSATVTVNKNGAPVPVDIEALKNGYAENTLVWLLQGTNDGTIWSRPAADENYDVIVSNVVLNGTTKVFSYRVTVFDPDVPTPGAPPTTVIAPASTAAGIPFSVTINPMGSATSYQLALHRLSPLSSTLSAATAGNQWTTATGPKNAYNPVEPDSFHLYHSDFAAQALTLNKLLHVGAGASLSFSSRFSWATAGEVARVQVSLDNGTSWQDVFAEAGSTSSASAVKSASLASYSGRIVRLRFLFDYTRGSSAYTDTKSGWYFDAISLTNVSELTDSQTRSVDVTNPSASLTALGVGYHVLSGRTEYQGMYFSDWGPVSLFQVAPSSTPSGSFSLQSGWNLVGNGSSSAIDVSTVFADTETFTTVWKWVPAQGAWAFHAPSLAAQGGTALSDYLNSKGYHSLTAISGGEGFWINAKKAATVTIPNGTSVHVAAVAQGLASGWNLVATGDTATPRQFGESVSGGITTLWAWSAPAGAWYFYAPSLDLGGGLAAYIQNKGYLDFSAEGKSLGPGTGFWVNKP